MTPLNDDSLEDMLCSSRQQVIDQRYPEVSFTIQSTMCELCARVIPRFTSPDNCLGQAEKF